MWAHSKIILNMAKERRFTPRAPTMKANMKEARDMARVNCSYSMATGMKESSILGISMVGELPSTQKVMGIMKESSDGIRNMVLENMKKTTICTMDSGSKIRNGDLVLRSSRSRPLRKDEKITS